MTSVLAIQNRVAFSFGLTLPDMKSARRSRLIARPRQVAMYLSKQLTTRSLPEIGRQFGNRDHTTVMHAVRRITGLMIEDEELRARVTELYDQLRQAPDAMTRETTMTSDPDKSTERPRHDRM